MGSTFNPQILMDKLSKLNNSQQSIETLSHWCIFHMNKAKQVVETWARQFHCSPREQRLAFLYLANDILQNSRRKGSEFVGEFWKVLPDALRDVIECGGDFGRNAALRLISIWEERKVFGSRGQILKDELVGRHPENTGRNGKHFSFKLKHCGNALDKIVSDYQAIYGGQLDEDVILSKCRAAINFVEEVDKEMVGDTSSGKLHGSGFVEKVQGQYGILKDCVGQLAAVESSRASLVSSLRVALHEQENKLDEIRSQLQAAQAHSEQACNMCQHLLNGDDAQTEQGFRDASTSKAPHCFTAGNGEQSAPLMYTQQLQYSENPCGQMEEDPRKSAAAAVAAKLTASTSSAQMLTYVLSSLASEGVIGGNSVGESSGNYPTEKKPKLEHEQSGYVLQHPQQLPMPPYSLMQQNVTSMTGSEHLPPPPPPASLPPLLPPLLPPMAPYAVPQFSQPNLLYSAVPSLPGYPVNGGPVKGMPPLSGTLMPADVYQNFAGPDGAVFGQQSLAMAPISRQ